LERGPLLKGILQLIKLFAVWATLICALATLVSCTVAQPKPTIGFVVPTLSNPYFIDMTNAAKEEAAKHPTYDLLVQAPGVTSGADHEAAIIENLIAQKVWAICVVPEDAKSIIPLIEKANRAGIPVFVLDTGIDPNAASAAQIRITSTIQSDNFLGGQLAGQFIANKLNGTGSVALLESPGGTEAALQRKSGFLESLKAFQNITVVSSQTGNWDRAKDAKLTQAILQANPHLGGIFACNDEIALGAVQAIEKNQAAAPKPIVVGFDAIKDALEAVKAGTMAATVVQMPKEIGRLGFSTAIQKLDGRPVPPFLATPVKLVTAKDVAFYLQ
jgi:ribose transport system substrate-binding protein